MSSRKRFDEVKLNYTGTVTRHRPSCKPVVGSMGAYPEFLDDFALPTSVHAPLPHRVPLLILPSKLQNAANRRHDHA